MRKIKSHNNLSTELRLLKLFKENDITGWRRHYSVKGHPDFVFLKKESGNIRGWLLLAWARLPKCLSQE